MTPLGGRSIDAVEGSNKRGPKAFHSPGHGLAWVPLVSFDDEGPAPRQRCLNPTHIAAAIARALATHVDVDATKPMGVAVCCRLDPPDSKGTNDRCMDRGAGSDGDVHRTPKT